MAPVESAMLALGTQAPDFELQDVISGRALSLASLAGRRGLLVMFICPHCPFVKHVEGELAQLGRDYAERDLAIVAIMPNDITRYPQDGPDGMRAQAETSGFSFPYLFDERQEAARAYQAACTPDFFLFDAGQRLVYRGQLDDSRPSNGKPVTGRDLRAALDALLAGQPVGAEQRPSIGCSIKWLDEGVGGRA